MSSVGCGWAIDEVGLTPIRSTMGCPVEMPPVMPPALLLVKPPSAMPSLAWLPRIRVSSNPLPTSMPLIAPTVMIAPVSLASSF